jgi:ankyrin repeat protein
VCRTALHFAAQNGHIAVVEELARLGAELDVVDEKENTPLHIAASLGYLGERHFPHEHSLPSRALVLRVTT